MATHWHSAPAALFAALIVLQGCSSLSLPSLDSLTGSAAPAPTTTAAVPAQPEAPRSSASFAVTTITGIPADKVTLVTQSLDRASVDKGLSLYNYPGAARDADYSLTGYFLSAPGKGASKGVNEITYVWDVMDRSGNRVGRASGNSSVPISPGAEAWSFLTPDLLQKVSEDATTQIVAARLGGPPAALAGPAPASATPVGQQAAVRR